MNESVITKKIMIALSEAGCLIYRNNTGMLKDQRGTPVRFGLCVGSSDLIGIAPDGRFLAVEVKAPKGRVTDKQQSFINNVIQQGGLAGVARSVNDALAIIGVDRV